MDTLLQFEQEEMSESILTLAAVARIADDERATLKAIEPNFPDGVGVLIEDDKEIPLTIREACNKIIHSKASRFELQWAEENPIWARWYKAQAMK